MDANKDANKDVGLKDARLDEVDPSFFTSHSSPASTRTEETPISRICCSF